MTPITIVIDIMRRSVFAILLSLLPAAAYCSGDISAESRTPVPVHENTRISDPHGWLRREDMMALEDRLNEFWKRTGLNVLILVDSSNNTWESLESFSERIARTGGMNGESAQQDEILFVVDPQARRAVVRPSAELKTDLPSDAINAIINDKVNPALMRGELAGGITEGIKHLAVLLEQHNRINRSIFIRGYGALAAIGIFLAGMILRRRWGPTRSAVAASLCFGAVVCFDGFNTGFSWYEVLSFVILSAPFLGLFVWIGMGNDVFVDPASK